VRVAVAVDGVRSGDCELHGDGVVALGVALGLGEVERDPEGHPRVDRAAVGDP